MSDDNDKSPSAAEIVDSMAEEMGIEDEDVPESDFSKEMMDELDGMFGVSSDDSTVEHDDEGAGERADAAPDLSKLEKDDPSGRDVHEEETVEMSLKVAKAVVQSDDLDPEVREQLGQALADLRGEDEEGAAAAEDLSAEALEEIEESGDEALAASLAALAEDDGGSGRPTERDVEPDEELDVSEEEKNEETTTDETDDQQDSGAADEGGSGGGGSVGGVFNPGSGSTKKKKKKKEPKKEEDPVDETADESAEESADEPEAADEDKEPEAADASSSESSSASSESSSSSASSSSGGDVGGVFAPGGGSGGSSSGGDTNGGGSSYDDDDLGYLDEDDLGDYEPSSGGMGAGTYIIIGLVAFVVIAAGTIFATGQTERVYHLFKGDLHEWEQAQAAAIKKKHDQEQLKKLPKYGTLRIKGHPSYADLKLDGETKYGKTSSGEWRVLRLKRSPNMTTFQNLDAKKPHEVTVSAPSHETTTEEITPGMWSGGEGDIDVQKTWTVHLEPTSELRRKEFKQRMAKDPENNYYGEVKITTEPEGAKVIFDNHPLLDEDGEEMTTPVTFKKYYVENKETGKLEEKKIKMDTPPDRGHKIQLQMPEEEGEYPKFVGALMRPMWTCEWKKEEKELEKLVEEEDEVTLPEHCEYKYSLDFSFEKLKGYIEARKQRIKEIKERNKKMMGGDKKAQKGEKGNGAAAKE